MGIFGQYSAEAVIALEKAMILNETLGDLEAVAAGAYQLAHIWVDAGRIKEARHSAQMAIAILRQIGSERVADIEPEFAHWLDISDPLP